MSLSLQHTKCISLSSIWNCHWSTNWLVESCNEFIIILIHACIIEMVKLWLQLCGTLQFCAITAEHAELGRRVEYARLGWTVGTQSTRVAQALRQPVKKAYPRLELCGTQQMRERDRERLTQGDRESAPTSVTVSTSITALWSPTSVSI